MQLIFLLINITLITQNKKHQIGVFSLSTKRTVLERRRYSYP